MKKLFTKICLPICACLLLFSCASDEFDSVADSASFQNLKTYNNQINDWNTISLRAMENVSFEEIAEEALTNECEVPTGTTGSLVAGYGSSMDLFSKTLGYKSIMDLNRWFIDYGKLYYNLVIEHRPDNEEEFVTQVAEMSLSSTSACENGCIQRMSVEAYHIARVFGIRTNVGSVTQTHNDIYGDASPIYHVYTMLGDKKSCEGSE